MALNLGLPIGCLAAAPGTDGDQLLAAGLSQFVGRYWTGEIVLLSVGAGSTALVTLGKSSLRAGVAGLGWLPAQAGTGMSKQAVMYTYRCSADGMSASAEQFGNIHHGPSVPACMQ